MNTVIRKLIFKVLRVVFVDVPFQILTETPMLTIDRRTVSVVVRSQ